MSKPKTCRNCQGTGEIHWNNGTQPRGFFELVTCPRCKGTGIITLAAHNRPSAATSAPNNDNTSGKSLVGPAEVNTLSNPSRQAHVKF